MDQLWDLWKDTDNADKNKAPTSEPQDKNALHSLPGVFIPKKGTVIFPQTHRAPSGRKHPRHAPPKQPATTVDCSLVSSGTPGDASWKPAASPVLRRPSKCQPADDNSPPTAVVTVVEAVTMGELPPKDPDQASAANPRLPADPRRTASAGFGVQDIARKGAGNSTGENPDTRTSAAEMPISGQPGAPGHQQPSPDPEDPLLGAEQAESRTPSPGQVKRRRDIVRRVVRKVRSHMARQPLEDAEGRITPPNATAQCRRGSCEYVLTDGQVQDIVEIICRELCNHSRQLDAEQVSDGKQPKMLGDSGEVHKIVRKPSCLATAIEPQASGTAGPTTTTIEPPPAIFSYNGFMKDQPSPSNRTLQTAPEQSAAPTGVDSTISKSPDQDVLPGPVAGGQAAYATDQAPGLSARASAEGSPTSSMSQPGGVLSSLKAILGTEAAKEENKKPEPDSSSPRSGTPEVNITAQPSQVAERDNPAQDHESTDDEPGSSSTTNQPEPNDKESSQVPSVDGTHQSSTATQPTSKASADGSTESTPSPNDPENVPEFHGFSIGSQLVSEINQRKESRRKGSSRKSVASDIHTQPELVSLPAPSKDLQTPPSGLDGQAHDTDNMYHLGIDARIGTSISVFKPVLVNPSPFITKQVLSGEDVFDSAFSFNGPKRTREESEDPAALHLAEEEGPSA